MHNIFQSSTSALKELRASAPFRIFLLLVGIEVFYVVGKEFGTGFWRGALSVAGG